MIVRAAVFTSTLVAALLSPLAAPQDPVFRTGTVSVQVDVAVHQNNRPVSDLGPDDFDILDVGVPQTVLEVARESFPIDLTCIVDMSRSVQGPVLENLTRAVNAIGERLRPDDRAAVITFNQQIRRLRPMQAGGWPDGLALGTPASVTSLFDAVTVSLIGPAEVGRRRMAIIFTDGIDSSSFVSGETLVDMARRADTAVFTVALTEGTVRRPARPGHQALFAALADTTGGALQVLQRDEDLSQSFIAAFESFRSSYVVRYVYAGPPRPGWHPIEVRIRRPGTFEVRARQGYFSEG